MASLNPAQLEKQLKGVNYPISKAELIRYVERNGADESIRAVLSDLPNQTYDSLAAVNRAISVMQQDNVRQDPDHNHQDQSQQGRQRAGR
jgi:hypothetical protein